MCIENLLNPISEQADKYVILPIPTDEQLAVNLSNTIITAEKKHQSEVDQDYDDDITKAEKIPLTLKEVTIACSRIHYSLSSQTDSAKHPSWKSHLNELLKLKNHLNLSQEANEVQKTLNYCFEPCY
ncbi:hypothetical protein O181_019551 [Austropuccinia psidii MF-1]|uniref:Uncharacterized protein n=1 Tax=Austropuccinia psidii MF-1 TaxID=1389203 RepID=A0A9Q3C7D6_9BASI|nr:hypothetical protein [Austropuccinia psidii MF-1]